MLNVNNLSGDWTGDWTNTIDQGEKKSTNVFRSCRSEEQLEVYELNVMKVIIALSIVLFGPRERERERERKRVRETRLILIFAHGDIINKQLV